MNILIGQICHLHRLAPSPPHTRIKECIDQIGQEIRDEYGQSDNQEATLNQRVIVSLHSFIEGKADTRIVEDDFCEQ